MSVRALYPAGRCKTAILGDFPYVARGLRKNLAFAISLVVTLALGIGEATAMFR
jgi:hypothetical protein